MVALLLLLKVLQNEILNRLSNMCVLSFEKSENFGKKREILNDFKNRLKSRLKWNGEF